MNESQRDTFQDNNSNDPNLPATLLQLKIRLLSLSLLSFIFLVFSIVLVSLFVLFLYNSWDDINNASGFLMVASYFGGIAVMIFLAYVFLMLWTSQKKDDPSPENYFTQ